MKTGVLPLPPLYWILRAATSCADKAQVGAWRTAFCARHTRCLLSTHCRNWRPGFAFAKTPALSRYCRGMGEPIGTSRLETVMKHTYGILLVVAGAFAFPWRRSSRSTRIARRQQRRRRGTLPARTRGRKPAAASAERRRARRRERQSVRCRVTSTTMLPGAFRTQTRRTRPRTEPRPAWLWRDREIGRIVARAGKIRMPGKRATTAAWRKRARLLRNSTPSA